MNIDDVAQLAGHHRIGERDAENRMNIDDECVLSWSQFDVAVCEIARHIASQLGTSDRSDVVLLGVPRGGLCLAVALSHALELPMVPALSSVKPSHRVVIVDEIVDTGDTMIETIQSVRTSGAQVEMFVAWVGRAGHKSALNTVTFISTEHDTDEWFHFPWEQNDD